MDAPLVSVVLPCFDAEVHLREAVDSLLVQTHRNLEVVAVDDGSGDRTGAILQEAAGVDPRVRIVTHPENLGLIATLNRGVAESRGAFIARMDADDVCRPDRLARQLASFREHPDTDVVGTGVRLIDGEGRRLGQRRPRARTPAGCRFLSYLATPVVHPSMMARAEVLRRHRYRPVEEALHAEDYELFARLVRHGVVIRNVDAPLLGLRQGAGSVSRRFEEIQVRNFRRSARKHLELAFGLRPSAEVHAVLVNRMDRGTRPGHLRRGLGLLDRLERRFLQTAGSGPVAAELRGITHEQRVDILLQAIRRGRPGLRMAAMAGVGRHLGSFLSAAGRRYLTEKRLR